MQQYLDLVRRILKDGIPKGGPQAEGTIAVFGAMMRFDLREGFPLITSRSLKSSWKALVHELLWFLSGSTSIADLHRYNVHLWDKWAAPEVCAQMGLPPGELGPIYGKQWRHWGPNDRDQITELIDGIKKNPDWRRHIVTAWNPDDLGKVFIAPCHHMFQCFVSDGGISLMLIQRSADVPVGVPFNIASYSLLLHMIAQVCDLEVREFIHVLGDAHIYNNQIPTMQELVQREPKALPHLRMNSGVQDIFDFRFEDFELVGYDPHPAIKDIPVEL